MRIVILDRDYFLSDFPTNDGEHEWEEYNNTTKPEIIPRLLNADIALTHGVPFDRETLMQLPKLKLISVNSTGYERIDIKACKEFEITVCNIKDWCTNSVVEHIFSFIFSLNRLQLPYHHFVQKGNWQGTPYEKAFKPSKEVRGSVLGIIGYGTIGKHLTNVCKGFGINVLIAEHKNSSSIRPDYVSFDEVIRQSDFIILQAPLSNQTFHFISYPEFEMMSSHAYLINCGRGGLIDEVALLDALIQKKIAGAALDVLEVDSFKNGNLFKYSGDNLILSPHIAFASEQSTANNTKMVMDNVRQFVKGSPINVVS